MPWLLASPGHQQPWYWLRRTNRSLFSMRNDFNYLSHLSVKKIYQKWKYIFMFPEINLAPQGLRTKLTTQAFAFTQYCQQPSPGLILGLHPANERCHYKISHWPGANQEPTLQPNGSPDISYMWCSCVCRNPSHASERQLVCFRLEITACACAQVCGDILPVGS